MTTGSALCLSDTPGDRKVFKIIKTKFYFKHVYTDSIVSKPTTKYPWTYMQKVHVLMRPKKITDFVDKLSR